MGPTLLLAATSFPDRLTVPIMLGSTSMVPTFGLLALEQSRLVKGA